jgi:hypothetical protein
MASVFGLSSPSDEQETVYEVSFVFLLLTTSVSTQRYKAIAERFSQFSNDAGSYTFRLKLYDLCSSCTVDIETVTSEEVNTPVSL